MTLRSYETGWMCQVCGTYNEPDYEFCQECLHDIDGTPPPKEDDEDATKAERKAYGIGY